MHKESATAFKAQPLKGRIFIPGDKSISHRALILGGIATGKTHIHGLLESDDVACTRRAMEAMGASIHKFGKEWVIQGVGNGYLRSPAHPLDFGNAATGVRLLMGLVGSYPIQVTFTGDKSLSARPMDRILEPLCRMGAEVVSVRGKQYLPITLKGSCQARAISYRVPMASAQVKSAVLLAGLNACGVTSIFETKKTRDHTEKMLQLFDSSIEIEERDDGSRVIRVPGQENLQGAHITIPSDFSSAAFLIVSALIVPDSELVLENILINPSRTGFLVTLQKMGADIHIKNIRNTDYEMSADLHVKASGLKATFVPAECVPSMIDEYPALAIAASFAEGTTLMCGLEELRLKESDRLFSLAEGLKSNGVTCKKTKNSLSITGEPGGASLGGGNVKTRYDHRIAMSFLIMGLATKKPVSVDDISMIQTSFPGFIDLMRSIGAIIKTSKESCLNQEVEDV